MTTSDLITAARAVAELWGAEVSLIEGRVYLSVDVPDCDETQDQHDWVWSYYCDVSDDLHAHGVQFDDPYTDHDTVAGYVIPLDTPPQPC